MTTAEPRRFPIRFERWYEALSTLLGLPPSASFVEIAGSEVVAQMGWAFVARFPRSAVAATERWDRFVLSRGVHGWAGRWLVNGSTAGLVAIRLEPGQRARVAGIPISLRELIVSVDDPEGLAAALDTGRRN